MRWDSELCRQLEIELPIIQAGMAGGPAGPALVSAVCEAGGLGTLGGGYMAPLDLREAVREIKEQTSKPFAVNLFSTKFTEDFTGSLEVNDILNVMRKKLGIPEVHRVPSTQDLFDDQFQVLLEEGVPVISTAFGLLPQDHFKAALEKGVIFTTMVTSVKEARLAEEQGVHVIIAQGSDAGGHRGTFDVSLEQDGINVGTLSLVPQIADSVSVPVAAAGGITDGRGVAAAFALGAQGVQLGTAFLCCSESAAHPSYKKAVLKSNEESTVLTRSFSGRPARGIRNQFIEHFEQSGAAPLRYPVQNTLTGDIRKEAARTGNPEFMSLWAGQAAGLLKEQLSAAEFVGKMVAEAEQVMRTLAKFLD
ncbi:NAD(P)H-dependent flavin oxidoreductase [Peribacillus kribbensis]|uniref:NAD(P)H-dependent flavin oxidoreductase n=1 Tax=Peribacillus kribbensis TaxID=356658 RepID=UPI0003FC1845|nr:nitronate monooxygenase family protein [Peribacillus kribbensis]